MLGTNPLRERVSKILSDPDPEYWREIHLELVKENGSLLRVELLRPLEWLDINQAEVGKTIHLDLPELGASGNAKVTYLGSCPKIEQNEGNVVTGRFIHESSDNLVNLVLKGQSKPTGVTRNHPYWSEDRQRFLPVSQLVPGERVRTIFGTTTVESINSRPQNEPVYNLEVHNEHVYLVDTLGTLVHNTCTVKLQSYKDDVLTKGVHADVFRDRKKITEALLRVSDDGDLEWYRWGDLATDRRSLREADRAIGELLDNTEIMNVARVQVRQAIDEMRQNLRHGTKKQKEFAE